MRVGALDLRSENALQPPDDAAPGGWLGALNLHGSLLPDYRQGTSAPLGPNASYGLGVIMNITNPKVALFFLALLPQFADPARGPLTLQLLQLGAVFICVTLVVFSSVAWSAGWLGGWLIRRRCLRIADAPFRGPPRIALPEPRLAHV